MEIYVINPFQSSSPHFPIIGMVPSYYSYVWNVQLYGRGYFELTVAASKENVALLKTGRMLVRAEDIRVSGGVTYYDNAMIIRATTISYDADNGYLLTVSGKTVKDILAQRIIFDWVMVENMALTTLITYMIDGNLINTTTVPQGMINDLESIIAGKQEQMAQEEDTLEELMTIWEQAIEQYGPDSPEAKAAKEAVDSCQATIDQLHDEINELTDQKAYWQWDMGIQAHRPIPYVSIGSVSITSPPNVTVQTRGDNLGEWIENECIENHLAWQMQLSESGIVFSMKNGTDRHSTVIFSPEFDNLLTSEYTKNMETYRNAALISGEGEGSYQKVANIGTSTGAGRFEEFLSATDITTNEGRISDTKYKQMLQQYGKNEIAKLKRTTSMGGDVDPNGAFKIGEDVFLGDLVTFANDQGISATVRLIEIIYSEDASGYLVTGTFEEED